MAYEVPRLGVKLELQLQAYTTATATWDPFPQDVTFSTVNRQLTINMVDAKHINKVLKRM